MIRSATSSPNNLDIFSRQKGSLRLSQDDRHRLWHSSWKTFWLIWARILVQAVEERVQVSGESFLSHHCLCNIVKPFLLPEATRFACLMIVSVCLCPVETISGLIVHSITSYLFWCNSAGTAREKHWYNGEDKRPCGALWWKKCYHSESVDNSIAFCLREKNGCEQRGRKRTVHDPSNTFMASETGGATTKLWNCAQSSHPQSFSFARRKKTPVFLPMPRGSWVSVPFLRLQQSLQLASFDCLYLLK